MESVDSILLSNELKSFVEELDPEEFDSMVVGAGEERVLEDIVCDEDDIAATDIVEGKEDSGEVVMV